MATRIVCVVEFDWQRAGAACQPANADSKIGRRGSQWDSFPISTAVFGVFNHPLGENFVFQKAVPVNYAFPASA
jgi:hypothetical protein